ncbi:MAG TPA: DUF1571 domain-containing protein [Pirellulales bacterium]|nr:DUF1571 domain-containing protein [Pirellulales bacterium]
MTWRTSLPRPAAPLASLTGILVTGFLLAQSAWAQSSADSNSVYDRRRLAETPLRQPQNGLRSVQQPYGAAGQLRRPPALYPQPGQAYQPSSPQSQRLAPAPGRRPGGAEQGPAFQGSAAQGFVRQPSADRAHLAGPSRPPYRDPHVKPAFYPAPINNPPADAAKAVEAASSIPAQLIAAPGEHKLLPAVRWAKTGMAKLETIQDYSCTLHKRERINGSLTEQEAMYVKVRHEPFSVYVYFLTPAKMKGQEAIFVRGKNDGNILAHPPAGLKKRLVGTVSLKPDSMLAMSGNRYPMTELGLRRLTERLIEVGEHDSQFGECDVTVRPGAKINRRDCTCIEVVHPFPRREFLFHLAKIYVDSEHNLPTRYEAYEWPQEAGGAPVLTEEYTYTNLKLNNGFTDKDFDPNNPEYDFK